ncbi:MAG TPA: hypothetical protein VHH88_12120 [Verrucomicrobiae bacterium]|nr:hypothetical protein [Verrucomicrobiae bacterium]
MLHFISIPRLERDMLAVVRISPVILLFSIAFALLPMARRAAAQIPPEPVCGLIAGPHSYSENSRIKRGPVVNLIAGDLVTDRPCTLRFQAVIRPRNTPMEPLQIEHEKLMHVLAVRDDLTCFMHIHPLRAGPGMWEVQNVFDQPGRYKFWTDIKYQGVNYSIGQPLVDVAGGPSTNETIRSFARVVTNGNYVARLDLPSPLSNSGTNLLLFTVRDLHGQPVPLERFLGVSMHLVAIRSDLSVFIHGHPEPRADYTAPIKFIQTFSLPGDYKLFAQFRPMKCGLQPGDAMLAQFWIRVGSAPPSLARER